MAARPGKPAVSSDSRLKTVSGVIAPDVDRMVLTIAGRVLTWPSANAVAVEMAFTAMTAEPALPRTAGEHDGQHAKLLC